MRNRAGTTLKLMGLLAALAPAVALAQSSPSAFTSATRYDAARRVTGTIEPTPGGTSAQTYLAVRNTYDATGRLVRVEKGALSAWQSEAVAPAQWSGFSVQSQVDTAYDAMDRKTIELVSSASAPYQVTQFSYDAFGRLECTAIRMNPALFPAVPSAAGALSLGSLPSSACTLGASGSDGPDRITKNAYDAAGQLLQVRKAVGTSIEEAYVTYSYTPDGKQSYVIDANGNRAQFVYDGFDRLSSWYFPSPTVPSSFDGTSQATALNTAGSINTGDYESYQYDADGNRTQLRKRDGQTLTFSYDALNRMTQKSGPTTPTVAYGYDLRGLQLTAKFGATARGVTNTFDGFGRQSSTSNDMDGAARTLTFQYDADSNRTGVTFPDGQYFVYDYDGLNRASAIRENGGGSVVTMAWDAQGRRSGETRGAVTSSYGYDAISRVTSLTDDLAGTVQDVTLSFGYNSASQITSRSRSNDAYRFSGYVNVDRGYGVNGLNQYASVAGRAYGYDGNGNLTSDGTTSYVYDSENRLVSTSAGISLVYDPLGRLYQVSGGSAGSTRFFYDGDQLVAEYNGSGTLLRRYVHGVGEDDPLLWYEGAGLGDRRSLQVDQQGSIVSMANASGTASIYSYDEYGIPGANQTGRFQYTGQAWIPELGMYYYKARIYSPTLGRFLQTDPIGYKDQVNLYAYVANDPIDGRDPTGLLEGFSLFGGCPAGSSCESSDPDASNAAGQDHTFRNRLAAAGAAGGAVGGGIAGGTAGAAACSPGGPIAAACATGGVLEGAKDGAIVGGLIGAAVGDVIDQGVALFNKMSGGPDSGGGSGGRGRVDNPTKQSSPVWQRLRNWRDGMRTDGKNIYSWDHTHNDIEVFNARGKHLGSMNPTNGQMYKPPVAGRVIPK